MFALIWMKDVSPIQGNCAFVYCKDLLNLLIQVSLLVFVSLVSLRVITG